MEGVAKGKTEINYSFLLTVLRDTYIVRYQKVLLVVVLPLRHFITTEECDWRSISKAPTQVASWSWQVAVKVKKKSSKKV